MPPLTLEEAALYPNSRTWAAAEGLYQIAALNEVTNPYVSAVPHECAFRRTPSFDQLIADTPMPGITTGFVPSGSIVPLASAQSHLLPYDISGAIFSALPQQTKFQVTARYYFERVPTAEDPNLLVLTRSPPHYDPVVFEIYSHAMGLLPVGVPVGENPLGEWFDTVMDVIATALPAVGTVLSPIFPPAGAIAAGAAAGAKAAKEWNKQNRDAVALQNRPKPRPIPPPKPPMMTVALKPSSSTTSVTVSSTPRKPLPPIPRKRT
jgi:hypothetical protein